MSKSRAFSVKNVFGYKKRSIKQIINKKNKTVGKICDILIERAYL